MPDCFISHAAIDAELADRVKSILSEQNLDAFVAPLSISPGGDWAEEVRAALLGSRLIIFLASREACRSPYVNQELGGAWFAKKRVIPVVWDMDPAELPGWISRSQAIRLMGDAGDLADQVRKLADSVKAEDAKVLFVALVALGAALFLGRGS